MVLRAVKLAGRRLTTGCAAVFKLRRPDENQFAKLNRIHGRPHSSSVSIAACRRRVVGDQDTNHQHWRTELRPVVAESLDNRTVP